MVALGLEPRCRRASRGAAAPCSRLVVGATLGVGVGVAGELDLLVAEAGQVGQHLLEPGGLVVGEGRDRSRP